MAHDGCWYDGTTNTTTTGGTVEYTFTATDPDLLFTPDQDDSWKLYALGTVTLLGVFALGLIMGRWLG